jgi:hypothetical protein
MCFIKQYQINNMRTFDPANMTHMRGYPKAQPLPARRRDDIVTPSFRFIVLRKG